MAEKKKTIWNKLGNILGGEVNPMAIDVDKDGLLPRDDQQPIIFSDRDEYEQAKLEKQQSKYFADQYSKIVSDAYQKSMYTDASRLASYIDFEQMEHYETISTALDTMAEESTCLFDSGKMLEIRSSSERIKKILEHLFYKTLEINTTLPAWTRNLVKYGDNFTFIKSEVGKGILKVVQLKNHEITRIEGDYFNKEMVNDHTKFIWQQGGQEFNEFQIAHFRLVGDDKKLPYGTSVLNKIRKVWRMLCLAEDAMMVYRISRSAERRVFKIDVGNLDPDDVEPYIQKVAAKFKRTTQVNQKNGQLDFRYNVLTQDEDFFIPMRNGNAGTAIDVLPGACLSLETKIELLDGRSLMLSDIIDEFVTNKELWVYSINPETGEIVPGKITWAGVTRKNTDVIKLTLDNGETIIVTPDHKIPTRFSGVKEAKDLVLGESLWSFNKEFKPIRDSRSEYEMIYDHSKKQYVYTHRMVGDYLKNKNLHNEWYYEENFKDSNKLTIHHKDINRFNNNPDNLLLMNNTDHYNYHSKEFKGYNEIGGETYRLKYLTDIHFKNEVDSRLHNNRTNYYSNRTDEKAKEHNEAISNGLKNFFNSMSESEKKEYLSEKGFLYTPENYKKGRIAFEKRFNTADERTKYYSEIGKKSSVTKNKKENKDKYSSTCKKLWGDENYRKSVLEPQTIKYSDILFKTVKETFNDKISCASLIEKLNENNIFITEFINLNKNIKRKDFTGKFQEQHLLKMLAVYGYQNYRHFKNDFKLFNHTVIKIEYLSKKIDTGTITVDGSEEFHNFHNFALSSGIFINNSNLDSIGDIEYLQNKLFSGLRVPKTFLGFTETAGDGKNLAMQDARFARTINRIQQAMLMELNKIALIHLCLLGFTDEINNFSLALANPSSQAEMLKLEILGVKLDVYKKAVEDSGNGWGAMSMTKAKKDILGMSDDEVVLDLQQQRIEKAEAIRNSEERLATKNLNSGLFNNLDKRYVDNSEANANNSMENPEGEQTGSDNSPQIGGNDGNLPPIPSDNTEIPEIVNEPISEKNTMLRNNNKLITEIHQTLKNVKKLLKE